MNQTPMHAQIKLPNFDAILQAKVRISGHAVRTPLLSSAVLNEMTGAKVFLKPENLQRTGSFKFRGAFNAVSALSLIDRQSGVVAVSSGNHGQGVADAARMLGAKAIVIMPSDAPKTKIDRTKAFGAEVILYDRLKEDREELVKSLLSKRGGAFIHPFNDYEVIAGQGTTGLEICEDLEAMGERLDRCFVCTGGGGLTAGIALAIKQRFPNSAVHTSEPENFDDYRRSLQSGNIERNATMGGSVCDAIVTPSPGEISFAINSALHLTGYAVSDDEALRAVAFAFRELKLVVEPGGAVALAALLQSGKQFAGQVVAITLSGGNVDPAILAKALAI